MYLITNRKLCSEERYLEVLKEASYNGVDYIVLREKDLNNNELAKLYYEVKNVVNIDTKIIINNNLEVFKEVDADGLHLSFKPYINLYDKDMTPKDKIIGVSTHSIEEILEIKKRKADYVFLSHIYDTKCKENLKPKGIEILSTAREILSKTDIKLVALGGILHSNVYDTLKYCDDVAIMSSIMSSDDVTTTIEAYSIKNV